jgi:hypothetical protein
MQTAFHIAGLTAWVALELEYPALFFTSLLLAIVFLFYHDIREALGLERPGQQQFLAMFQEYCDRINNPDRPF